MENSGYFFAAFALVWAAVFAYVLVLVGRQRRLKREVESLKKLLKENEETGVSAFTGGKQSIKQ